MTMLLESAIRVTLIAAIIALVLFAMRIRTASVLHAVWAGVVVLMMLLPVWVAWGPKAAVPLLPSQPTVAFAPLPTSPEPVEPSSITSTGPVREDGGYALPDAVTVIYFLGFGVLLLRLAIGTVRASRLKSCVAPITVGILRPRIILPESSREWPQAQLDAVLAHEGEHVRRRDPLFQWIALLNRAIFWFHPLAWWLERKLSGLAEEACDAAVISRGCDPREYSEYLLDLARSVERAGTRIEAVGMAMPGIGLKHRIRQMLSGVPVPRISRPRMACTIAVCAAAAAILAAGTLVRAQPKVQLGPVFEVASIKPARAAAGKSSDGRGRGGPPLQIDHRRFSYTSSLFGFIIRAYGIQECVAGGEAKCARLSGGPDWLMKDQFEIQAKMPDNSPDYTVPQLGAGQAPQLQSMLQALLAERFNLKIHREKKQLPVYALTIAKNGPKLKKTAGEMVQLADGSSAKKRNLFFNRLNERTIQLIVIDRSIPELTDALSRMMDRPVLDRTGIKGEFDFTIEYERDLDAQGLSRIRLVQRCLPHSRRNSGSSSNRRGLRWTFSLSITQKGLRRTDMQTLLIESALRATLIAAVIALVLFAMRIRTAPCCTPCGPASWY